ncbi:hypothetical protein FRC96_00725 [Lujinxingia vulgaris]|uniref:Lipoprotein n=1 Tax=Lujinxingia vulgaris TaxID=2600176 RepID=A0A5C6XTJ0_9DELT|nr:hypothetical protein [Lujinxingia vulgaris]TXD44246.1 hypothetical protein FRC96_00725 [Lujinxingia vulgaris]
MKRVGGEHGERRVGRGAILALIVVIAGCVSAPERYARQVRDQTYQAHLEQGVRAMVYPLGCSALLPWAEQHLWEAGFEGVSIDLSALEVRTGWRSRGPSMEERYTVYGRAAGAQRCAWQFMRSERGGEATREVRDVEMEMHLLERISPQKAREVRLKAQAAAERAYDETRQMIEEDQAR